MATVTVYEFEIWDPGHHRWVKHPKMGTLQAVVSLSGVPALHTSLVVDESRVDAEGFVSKPSVVSY